MEYWYEKQQRSFTDFASGKVLFNAQGTTSFPVRLASEIVQRCFDFLETKGIKGPYTLYDPCCGGAYMVTVIGLMHGSKIRNLFASDINPDMLRIAASNLSLLSQDGMRGRKEQLEQLIRLYNKTSHHEALQSISHLTSLLSQSAIVEAVAFQADFTSRQHLFDKCKGVDMIMADVPYGDIANWTSASSDPLSSFFEQAHQLLNPGQGVVAIIANKSQKLKHDKFERIQYFKIGKRHVGIFAPIASPK